ncbi:hypothetical protein [Nocardia sp. NPDC058497]|uniref:hypothetical protein n=1 Tax=Nocardia sp. NPDC058497 TaxID=3346529 RepID=UPI00365C1112
MWGLCYELAVAHLSEPWRRPRAKINAACLGVVALEIAILGGLRFGPLGVLFPLVIAALLALLVWRGTQHPSETVLRVIRPTAAPGATLAAQFGSDAVLIAAATYLLRVPYTAISAIDIRGSVAAFGYGELPIMLPSALFPPEIVGRLRELGVQIVEH